VIAEDDETPETPQLPMPMPPKIVERLFESRTILLHGEITSKLAQEITAQLLALAAAGDEPITMFLHSEGGHVEAGDTIHDMIKFVKPRVRIVGTGWVASAARTSTSRCRRRTASACPTRAS
jgi:ATP-dependent Clp protease protease subunit